MLVLAFMIYVLSIISICVNYNYFIKCLICLEFMLFSLIYYIYFSCSCIDWVLIYVLVIGVCDGILGLLVIVYLDCLYGSDYYGVSNYDSLMY